MKNKHKEQIDKINECIDALTKSIVDLYVLDEHPDEFKRYIEIKFKSILVNKVYLELIFNGEKIVMEALMNINI